MKLYRSSNLQKLYETEYPEEVEVIAESKFAYLVQRDHICSNLIGRSRRTKGTEFISNKQKFISADCIFADIDNGEVTDPLFYIDKKTIMEVLYDVEFWLTTSKSHMKQKGVKSPRPKWHLYFPISTVTDYSVYEGYIKSIHKYYEILTLDSACSDCSRYVDGVGDVVGEVIHHPGKCVLDVIAENAEVADGAKSVNEFKAYASRQSLGSKIKTSPGYKGASSGGRNNSLFRYLSGLQAHGWEDADIRACALEANQKNNPPLAVSEVDEIVRGLLVHIPKGPKDNYFVPQQTKAMESTKTALGVGEKGVIESDVFANYRLFLEGKERRIYVGPPEQGNWVSPSGWMDSMERKGIPGRDCSNWLRNTTAYWGRNIDFSHTGDIISWGETYYNTFTGWRDFGPPGSCDLFLEHIRSHLCKGDESLYNYVMSWMADMIQDPSTKKAVALCIQGDPATGKTSIANVLRELFQGYVGEASSVESITGRFNRSMLEGKILTMCDEGSAGRADYEKLKSIISDEYIATEEKNARNRSTRNYTRFLITRNPDKPFPVEMGQNERRWAIITIKPWLPDRKSVV